MVAAISGDRTTGEGAPVRAKHAPRVSHSWEAMPSSREDGGPPSAAVTSVRIGLADGEREVSGPTPGRGGSAAASTTKSTSADSGPPAATGKGRTAAWGGGGGWGLGGWGGRSRRVGKLHGPLDHRVFPSSRRQRWWDRRERRGPGSHRAGVHVHQGGELPRGVRGPARRRVGTGRGRRGGHPTASGGGKGAGDGGVPQGYPAPTEPCRLRGWLSR